VKGARRLQAGKWYLLTLTLPETFTLVNQIERLAMEPPMALDLNREFGIFRRPHRSGDKADLFFTPKAAAACWVFLDPYGAVPCEAPRDDHANAAVQGSERISLAFGDFRSWDLLAK
jgi:hypothetical protein